jgi:hypothetical protein
LDFQPQYTWYPLTALLGFTSSASYGRPDQGPSGSDIRTYQELYSRKIRRHPSATPSKDSKLLFGQGCLCCLLRAYTNSVQGPIWLLIVPILNYCLTRVRRSSTPSFVFSASPGLHLLHIVIITSVSISPSSSALLSIRNLPWLPSVSRTKDQLGKDIPASQWPRLFVPSPGWRLS